MHIVWLVNPNFGNPKQFYKRNNAETYANKYGGVVQRALASAKEFFNSSMFEDRYSDEMSEYAGFYHVM